MDLLIANWPLALIAAVVALVLLFLLLRPRQRVALSDNTPVRPHMAVHSKSAEGKSLVDEAVAAAADVSGSILSTRVHDELPGAAGSPDDLAKLKGVGPKLAGLLNAKGLTRFDQIAKLSPGQVEEIDNGLGAFRGRLTRDQVVDQADYLARGDIDGFEQKYGKL